MGYSALGYRRPANTADFLAFEAGSEASHKVQCCLTTRSLTIYGMPGSPRQTKKSTRRVKPPGFMIRSCHSATVRICCVILRPSAKCWLSKLGYDTRVGERGM